MFHNFSKKIVAAEHVGDWVGYGTRRGGSISSGSPRLPQRKPHWPWGGITWAVPRLGWCRRGSQGARRTHSANWSPLPSAAVQEWKHPKENWIASSFHYLLPETKCMSQVRIGPVDAPRDTLGTCQLLSFGSPLAFHLCAPTSSSVLVRSIFFSRFLRINIIEVSSGRTGGGEGIQEVSHHIA